MPDISCFYKIEDRLPPLDMEVLCYNKRLNIYYVACLRVWALSNGLHYYPNSSEDGPYFGSPFNGVFYIWEPSIKLTCLSTFEKIIDERTILSICPDSWKFLFVEERLKNITEKEITSRFELMEIE